MPLTSMTYTVELRTHSASAAGVIPHTFLVITGPGGSRGYGFAPHVTGLTIFRGGDKREGAHT